MYLGLGRDSPHIKEAYIMHTSMLVLEMCYNNIMVPWYIPIMLCDFMPVVFLKTQEDKTSSKEDTRMAEE